MVSKRRRVVWTVIAAGLLTSASALAACGGDDDEKPATAAAATTGGDANPAAGAGATQAATVAATATTAAPATATTAPAASPTSAPAGGDAAYRSQTPALAGPLRTAVNQMQADMDAANNSRLDPRWPGILNRDADNVIRTAQALQALQATGADAATDREVDAACARLVEGANSMKRSVQRLNPADGELAYNQIAEGENLLNAALAKLGL